MAEKPSAATRWKNFEPTKNGLVWACITSAALTMLVGFNFGGWVTGGTARAMASSAANEARIEIAVDSCVARFNRGTEAPGRLAMLKKTTQWMRGTYLEKAGWATLMGAEDPTAGAGERCAEYLLSPETARSNRGK